MNSIKLRLVGFLSFIFYISSLSVFAGDFLVKIESADKIRERIFTYETAMGSYDDVLDTNDYYNIAKLSEIADYKEMTVSIILKDGTKKEKKFTYDQKTEIAQSPSPDGYLEIIWKGNEFDITYFPPKLIKKKK